MDFSTPLPKLNYDEHHKLRKDYKYSDDLINPHNWSSDIKKFNPRINSYIDLRNRYGEIRSKELREIGLPPKAAREYMYEFKTISAKILNHTIFEEKIGKNIKNQYESYIPEAGFRPTQLRANKINYVNVEKLPRFLLNTLEEMKIFKNNMRNGIIKLLSKEFIDHHKKFLNEIKLNLGLPRTTAKNPYYSKYKVYPEIIGHDIAKMTGNKNTYNSVAIAAGGLFDWKYVTPQQRSVGSATDLGAMIIDIIASCLNKDNSKELYNQLISSNIIDKLEDINGDRGDITTRNPFLIGINDHEYRRPEMYSIWCANKVIKSIFYNKNNENNGKTLNFDLESKTEYKHDSKNITYQESNASKEEFNRVIDILEKKLKIDTKQIITNVNTSFNINTSLQEESIKTDIIKNLKNIDDNDKKKIIAKASTCLYLELLIAKSTNWQILNEVYSLNIDIYNKLYDIPIKEQIIKLAHRANGEYREILERVIGITASSPMGGLSLIKYSPLITQKNGNIIEYPGDVNVLETISSFIPLFQDDISYIEKQLSSGIFNMANKYWYRDILKWIEVLFNIFEPHESNHNSSHTSAYLKEKFYRLEQLLKVLYTKQITLIQNYIQKEASLQRRIDSDEKVNVSLEKEIKNISNQTKTVICYIKRQIQIIYHLLEKTMESWWATRPSNDRWRPVDGKPAFVESEYGPTYRTMKSSLKEWFRSEISKLFIEEYNIKIYLKLGKLVITRNSLNL